ncbi:MAG: hypothetical protein ABL914_13515, partial [Novosphingobium sp.]|uniref:hypothetical protein n=1 Tax=Novosphingobium sp. TaxID=1874826 RepID=UPI0032BCA11B
VPPGAPQHREMRTHVIHGDGSLAEPPMPPAPGVAHVQCGNGKPFTARVERQDKGQREVSVMSFCLKGGSPAQSLEGLRHARARVSADTHLSPEAKAEVLRQIDAEIARLEKIA